MSSFIILIVGLVFVLVSVNELLRFRKLFKTGISADGIVYGIESSDSSNIAGRNPTIRFITKNNEWITEKYKVGLMPGMLKKGQNVKVLYNPGNPSEFVLNAPLFIVLVVAIGAAGAILIGFGIIKLLSI